MSFTKASDRAPARQGPKGAVQAARRSHCWFVTSVHGYCLTAAPSAVEPETTSKQFPLCRATHRTYPPPAVWACHCWFVPPFHVHCTAAAPSAVEPSEMSRHFPLCRAIRLTYPLPRSSTLHCWFQPPLQEYCFTGVPSSRAEPGMSAHFPLRRATNDSYALPVPTPATTPLAASTLTFGYQLIDIVVVLG